MRRSRNLAPMGEKDPRPGDALARIAEQLRGDETVISSHVVEPARAPALGPLAAAGPRAVAAPGEYALVIEAIREGYELHYGTPRLLAGQDEDLALLAGDYLYALGLERLAALGDGEAVAELSDLISLCAASHTEAAEANVPSLWLAAAVAVGCGDSAAHRAAKALARAADPAAAEALLETAAATAAANGLLSELDAAAESLDFAIPRPADLG
jgi:hypothetical protein